MKLEKRSNANLVPFKNVPAGAVFRDTENTVYMKLDACYKHASIVLYNAVVLENGSLVYFDDQNEKVEVLDDAILTY